MVSSPTETEVCEGFFTIVTHLFSAIYRDNNSIYNDRGGAHLVPIRKTSDDCVQILCGGLLYITIIKGLKKLMGFVSSTWFFLVMFEVCDFKWKVLLEK